jgi:superfamily I DNA and/or RNA helicase
LPSVFYAACLARTAAVMVGDPRQLPSIVQSDDPYVRRAMGRNVFEIGTAGEERRPFVAMLRTQYRMHPVIGELVSTLFYGSELTHAARAADVDPIVAMAPYAGSPLVLVDTAGRGSARADAGGSRINDASAELSAALARQAVGAGIRSVAVITPYVAQARRIRELLGREMRGAVECSTVHRFQGHERDLVILDTVDAEPMRPGVLLTDGSAAENLLNVSLSRARGKVIVVADRGYFARTAPRSPVARVVEAVASTGVVISQASASRA